MSKIGVFDSGVGGLTVARSIYELGLFDELIYYGDLAHLPYGDKSEAAIQAYSVRIAEFLVAKGCETIVIACNSASASATELLKEYLDRKIRIINVIDPMVRFVAGKYNSGTVGIIGTKRTINSGVYQKSITGLNPNIEVRSLATPLLVPVIEENLFSNKLRRDIINEYLDHGKFNECQGLILGCTHYPIIKDEISVILGNSIEILDSSEVMAGFLASEFPNIEKRKTRARFYASDITPFFRESANLFFGGEVELEYHSMVNIF